MLVKREGIKKAARSPKTPKNPSKYSKESIKPFTHSRHARPLTLIIEELAAFIEDNTPDILKNPESMVGCQVHHQFLIDGQTKKWYYGNVVGYNSSEKIHEIMYEGEEENCFFDLSIDIANGDLQICS